MDETASQAKASKPVPLTPGDVQKFVAALPSDPLRALDIVLAQINAIADNVDPGVRFVIVSQLDEAVQRHIKQVTQEYLRPTGQNKANDVRLWALAHDFWTSVADQYGACVATSVGSETKSAQQLRAHLPRIISRALRATGE
ncbi:MAG: hypothetical protein LBI31_05585, partial [Zoogloeaceae bacterium]|nr:hypothetical protein [Zoogloeaceae bacterium]